MLVGPVSKVLPRVEALSVSHFPRGAPVEEPDLCLATLGPCEDFADRSPDVALGVAQKFVLALNYGGHPHYAWLTLLPVIQHRRVEATRDEKVTIEFIEPKHSRCGIQVQGRGQVEQLP